MVESQQDLFPNTHSVLVRLGVRQCCVEPDSTQMETLPNYEHGKSCTLDVTNKYNIVNPHSYCISFAILILLFS